MEALEFFSFSVLIGGVYTPWILWTFGTLALGTLDWIGLGAGILELMDCSWDFFSWSHGRINDYDG